MPLDTIFSQQIGAGRRAARRICMASSSAWPATTRPGLVRLVLASTLQRLPVDRRLELAAPSGRDAEDAPDHNIPALIWTGLIPVAAADPEALVALAGGLPAAERRAGRSAGGWPRTSTRSPAR